MLPYKVAFLDWLACACAGSAERAPVAVRTASDGVLGQVAFAAAAGHVLDYDDTFPEGVAHLSAATAPAALVLAARLARSAADALEAYAAGFEAMAAVAQASHPALYDGGWHPTAVCGPVGAAVAAAQLLGLDPARRESAMAAAMLRAGGTRGAFGSDGKSIQVGMAAAAGVQGALLAQAGAIVDHRAIRGPLGFESVLRAAWPPDLPDPPAIQRNWIKLHPSCLGTHAPIDAAAEAHASADGVPLTVRVHPLARQAAHLEEARTGLEAKFSIPYCVAHTLMHGPPGVADFDQVDPRVVERSTRIGVADDESMPEFGASLSTADGLELASVAGPLGSPARPASEARLAAKVTELAGTRLNGILDNLSIPAAAVVEAAGLG